MNNYDWILDSHRQWNHHVSVYMIKDACNWSALKICLNSDWFICTGIYLAQFLIKLNEIYNPALKWQYLNFRVCIMMKMAWFSLSLSCNSNTHAHRHTQTHTERERDRERESTKHQLTYTTNVTDIHNVPTFKDTDKVLTSFHITYQQSVASFLPDEI